MVPGRALGVAQQVVLGVQGGQHVRRAAGVSSSGVAVEALVEEGVEELRVDVDGAEDLLGRAEGLHHVIGQGLARAVVPVYPEERI